MIVVYTTFSNPRDWSELAFLAALEPAAAENGAVAGCLAQVEGGYALTVTLPGVMTMSRSPEDDAWLWDDDCCDDAEGTVADIAAAMGVEADPSEFEIVECDEVRLGFRAGASPAHSVTTV